MAASATGNGERELGSDKGPAIRSGDGVESAAVRGHALLGSLQRRTREAFLRGLASHLELEVRIAVAKVHPRLPAAAHTECLQRMLDHSVRRELHAGGQWSPPSLHVKLHRGAA